MSIPTEDTGLTPQDRSEKTLDPGTAPQADATPGVDAPQAGADTGPSPAPGSAPRHGKHFSAADLASLPDPAQDYNPMQEVVRHKHRRKRHHRALRIAAVIVAVLIVAAAGGALYVNHSIQAGKDKLLESARPTVSDDSAEGLLTYNGQTYHRKDSVVSVAILGFDRTPQTQSQGLAGQADAIMVAAIDTQTGKLNIIAVPRDSMVAVDRYSDGAYMGQVTEQICLAFSYGDGYHTSCQYTVDAIERVFQGIPISYYFALDMDGIAPLNDSIGGVYLTPLESIPSTGIVEGQDMVLYGKNARSYVQWRDTSQQGTSLKRQARQQQYLKAFMEKVLSNAKGGDISSLLSLYNTAGSYSISNLGIDEYSYLATLVAGGDADPTITSLKGEFAQNDHLYNEYDLDEDAVMQTILDVYYEKV